MFLTSTKTAGMKRFATVVHRYTSRTISSVVRDDRGVIGHRCRGTCRASNTLPSLCSFNGTDSRGIISKSLISPEVNIPSVDIRRQFSTDIDVEPIIDTLQLQNAIIERAAEMSEQLASNGYYSTTNILPRSMIELLRMQSILLRNNGRFEQSWSEKIIDGQAVQFDKDGVFACEPDGQDYYDAPDLIVYMSVLLQTLPAALNGQSATSDVDLSNSSFNAKLAVTSPGGSKYPLHIDNPQGLSVGDTRKLTCLLYLNPDYKDGDGGELRIFLPSNEESGNETLGTVDLTPEGGRMLLFWSDEIPHEVLATAPHANKDDASLDRYALTVWIPTTNVTKLHDESSKFRDLKDLAF